MLQKSASVLSTQLAKSLSAIVTKKERTAAASSAMTAAAKRGGAEAKVPKPLIPVSMKYEQFLLEAASEVEMARQVYTP